MELTHDFGFAEQAPVGIHENLREVEEEGGGRGLVVVAVAGMEGGQAGGSWVLYKEVRTPNSQYQWDFLRISDPLDHLHQIK